MIYKTKGIILKRSNFGEADRLLTIFSESRGKLKVVAKGVRKQTSKLGGHLELFCLSDLAIAEGRNLDIVTEAVICKPYQNIRRDLTASHASYYLAEIVDKLTVEHEAHENIFTLLEEAIERIDDERRNLLLPYFEMNLLKNIGYEPELKKCLKCESVVEPHNNSFDFEEGGLVCAGCGGTIGKKISEEAIKIIRLMLTENMSILDRLKPENKIAKEVENITGSYIRHVHQDDFKSKRFV